MNNLFGQDLTVSETVNYINKKLQDNPKGNDVYQIDVTPDGYLIIYDNSFYSGTCKLTIHKFLIMNVTIESDQQHIHYEKGTIGFLGMKILKEGTGDCESRNIQLTDSYNYYSQVVTFSNDENIHESLFNAFTHLFNLVNSDPTYRDPFANKRINSDKLSTGNASNAIQLEKTSDGLYKVPVVLNGVLKISIIYDSGSSDVSISPDIAMTLIRTGTLTESDYIGTQSYMFADGTYAKSKRIIIRELQIGNQTITNVEASISNSINAPMLLGQSVLKRFGTITIDNNSNTLLIQK